MKVLFLIYHLIIRITIIHASNQYLGCFIDQIGNRDLNIFIGDYEQLTPQQCILACRAQNFPYAAIQYGNECRCGQQYGKYGQVSEAECNYLCSTSEKCGGDHRNSVYNGIHSIDRLNPGFTCQNSFVGYQGCFESVALTIRMDVVNSIDVCIERCVVKYNYAGIMNGNLCYCGNDMNLRPSDSNLCNIRCTINSNDCCGGPHVLSIYKTHNSQSSLLLEKLIRVKRANAANNSTFTTDISSVSTFLNNSTPSNTISLTAITAHTSFLPILSTVSSSLNLNTTVSQSISSIPSTMNDIPAAVHSSSTLFDVTPTTPITATDTTGVFIATAHMSTSITSTSGTPISNSTSSISTSQPSTNPLINTMSSAESSSLSSVIFNTAIPASFHIEASEAITSTATAVASQSSSYIEILDETSIGTTSSLNTMSSQTSSYTDTTISDTLAVTLTSTYTDTAHSAPLSSTTEFNSINDTQSANSIHTETTLTSTMISVPMSSEFTSTTSIYLSQISTSSNPSIVSDNPSSFSTIMTTESPSISSITSTLSSQVTATISQENNSESSIPTTSFLSTNSLAHNSTNIEIPTTSFHTDITVQTTVTSANTSSTTANQIVNSTTQTTTTTIAPSFEISTIIIVPLSLNFTPNDNTTRETIRSRLSAIINLAFQCLTDSSYPNCLQTRRRMKRQLCQTGYNVDLVSNITEISNTTSSESFLVNYTVRNPCNQNTLISPIQVKTATDTLSSIQITRMLGYAYEGDFIRSTAIENTDNATPDRKLWIIGAVLGPVAFTLLLILLFCYLHYKCRPRPTNRSLTKVISNAPLASARATDYQAAANDPVKEPPTAEKNILALTQNDLLVGTSTSFRRITPTESEKSTDRPPEYRHSKEIPMDEIRRQNDVERWRNKLRLQEKFQQSSIGLQDPSIPNTARSYDNQAFEHDPSHLNIQPANDIISTHTPRPLSRTPELEAGRTKLHRLLDEVLDKADSEESYNPDSDFERQKRRRQRRRIHSISTDQNTLPSDPQIPHIPVIPQVSERPDPSLLRLRYNPYEAGDRAHDISRLPPVELKPKYATDDQRSTQYSSRSNPPLFYDDSTIADRAATATDAYANPKRFARNRLETDREAVMRHDGGRVEQRQHKFNDDAVYIDSLSKNRDGYRVHARTAWVEPETDNGYLGENDYLAIKRSVANTRNIISSIHDELQHISLPLSEDYHA